LSFFEELKRRNVFRVGIAYAISAWVLLQFVDLVLENIQAPDWIMKVFMLALAVGFPLAIFFAWAFEMTPEGIKKEKDVDRSQSITNTTGRKLDRSIIVVLLIAVVYFAWDNFGTEKGSGSVSPQETQLTESSAQGTLNTAPASQKSIAVLPFVNMSTDAENEFFSDGISEEILNVLASIPDLKVAARTSAFAYKGTNTKISQIARELGVNHVLEGSVRKSGNQVRVTAQLIKADDGFHLWSANYDRELTNIFAIQDEIAGSIADALKVSLKLESNAAGNLTGTSNIEAYEHYLKGMSLWYQRTVDSLYGSIDEFGAAISIDPEFAKAYAGLSLTWSVIEGYVAINNEESQKKAESAANTALSLDPDNIEATAALGSVAKDRFKYSEAIAHFERAIQLNPSFATAYQWYGGLLLVMGETEAALTRYKQAWDLDPRSRITGNNLAVIFYMLGRNQEATAMAQEVFRFAPEFPEVSKVLLHLAIADGECEIAEQHGNRLAAILKKTTNATPIYIDLCQSADPEARARAIETMVSWQGLKFSSADAATLSYPEDLVMLLADMGEFEAALTVAENNLDYYNHIVLTWLRAAKTDNAVKLYCDPRVQALFDKTEIPPMEGKNICD
jgi:TolB-like protein/Tfp pilus assembly protein PilF